MPSLRFPMSPKQCHSHWSNLWLLSGDDAFLIQNTTLTLCNEASKCGMAIERVTIQKATDWQHLASKHQQASLFVSKTCIVITLKNWTLSKDTLALLHQLIAHPATDKVWILQGPKLTKAALNKASIQTLVKHGNHVPIWPMDNKQLSQWLTIKAEESQLTLTKEASRLCINQADGAPIALWQMLQHLSLLDRNSAIDHTLIEQLVQPKQALSIFAWQDFILQGDFKQALQTLPRLQAHQTEPVALLGLLQKTFEQLTLLLWAKKQGLLSERLRTLYPWPKQRQMITDGIMKHSPRKITQFRQELFVIERSLKTTYPYDVWQAISALLLGMCQASTPTTGQRPHA